MQSIPHIASGTGLIAGTVAIHSAGTFFLMWRYERYRFATSRQPGYVLLTARLTSVVLALLLVHTLEVALWGSFFYFHACFPDMQTSMYFSLITYATVGYGDVVLNEEWRMFGGIEALIGVLMMSWSTAVLMGYVQWVYSCLAHRWGRSAPKI